MKYVFIFLSIYFLSINITNAQDVPTPAKKQEKAIAIVGARLHVGNGQVIENSVLVFDKGKIIEITTVDKFTNSLQATIIDAKNKDVYPGAIAPITSIGLQEVEAVRATNDVREVGLMNSNVRSAIAYNTDSRVTPTIRTNGILTAQIVPEGGRISGTSSIAQLDAWNWQDAMMKDDGVWLNFPNMYSYSGWRAEPGSYEKNKEYDNQVMEINDFLEEAKAYTFKSSPLPSNLKYEAMKGIFEGTKNLYVRANGVKEIESAVSLCEKFNIKPVIVGGYDSYLIANYLAEKNIAVILDKCHALPSRTDDDIQQNYKTPAILQKAGVLYCIAIDGSWQTRNLFFEAGTASAFGLSKEEALASITNNTAKILKIDNQIGTVEVGKNATIIISEGDVLDMATSKISYAFIEGRQIDLGNKQIDLFKKFAEKYGIN
jgi:imidazolonepropionase-like amidohydrolase